MSGNGTLNSPFDIYTAATNNQISSGSTMWVKSGNKSLPETLTLSRPYVTWKPYTVRPIFQGNQHNIEVYSDGIILRNLDIVGVNPNRISNQSSPAPNDINLCYLNVTSKYVKLQGCRLIDIGEIFVNQACDGFEMTDCLVLNQGWSAPDRGHGHAAYVRNNGIQPLKITNCFFGPGFGWGVHAYGNATNLIDITIDGLIQANPLFLIGGEATTPLDLITVKNCLFWNVSPDLGYNTLYDQAITRRLTHQDNRYYGGGNALTRSCWTSVTQSGNVVKSSDTVNEIFIRNCTTSNNIAWVVIYNWNQDSTVNVAVPNLANGTYKVTNAFDPLNDYADIAYSGSFSFNFTTRSIATPLGFSNPLMSLSPKFGVWHIS